jgi:hypothetical protein
MAAAPAAPAPSSPWLGFGCCRFRLVSTCCRRRRGRIHWPLALPFDVATGPLVTGPFGLALVILPALPVAVPVAVAIAAPVTIAALTGALRMFAPIPPVCVALVVALARVTSRVRLVAPLAVCAGGNRRPRRAGSRRPQPAQQS